MRSHPCAKPSLFFLLFAFFPDPDKKIDSLLVTVCAVNGKEMCTDRPPQRTGLHI